VIDYARKVLGVRRAFRLCFLGDNGQLTEHGETALAELRRFCYGNRPMVQTTMRGVDPYATVAAAARNEVFQRIVHMLNLDDRDIVRMQEFTVRDDNG